MEKQVATGKTATFGPNPARIYTEYRVETTWVLTPGLP